MAFDVQKQALLNSQKRLQALPTKVHWILAGHQNLTAYVNEPLDAAIFNFGWLPSSDKSCTTEGETSVKALAETLELLKVNAVVVAVLYSGHITGKDEAAMIEHWAQKLQQQTFSVLRYGFINQRNHPPYLLAIERLNT